MKIANEFTVSVPIEDAWDLLTDLDQVVPLMPGARLTGHDGDDVLGAVKVKVGPVTSEFAGKVHFVEQDREHFRAVIDAKGKETRGTGNAAATVTAQLHEAGTSTRVTVDTDLKVVGKLAQFGSGMLQQVSEKLLGQFVDSLEAKLAGEREKPSETTQTPQTPVAQAAEKPQETLAAAAPAVADPEPIDLLDLAGGAALKKYGPAVAGAFLLAALLFTIGRLRMARKALRGR
ncbi:SRPBCC family protein [Mycolicibacterium smegmatis]|uniref:Carbon monoxide dehydrogenase subunit G (CoxG) family protein n=1 Tax=Mycolicibacterium smegmatis (strain MKD8) TaxID=1214915 RepID=A0A2U9PJG0_MYCSE|nr:SRPBCC family protein [Mycolicibacterium smegmatis]AWT51805.1 carbon monoxide dehydrogenase subunit G (CoxG) family protein [Mycolicibacterium smegmatis MKD8]ULN36039.1 SRPBCC family protein [Mycolicibacterium smegmatis]